MNVLEKGIDYLIVLKEAGENSENTGFEGFGPLYRLDVPVRGILVLTAKGSHFEVVEKEYCLVCAGKLEQDHMQMTDLLFHDARSNRTFPVKRMRKGVREARLDADLLGYNETNDLSLVRAVLDTGRTHQIRAQFAARKHPLAGDGKYGSRVKCPVALMCSKISYKASEHDEIKTVSVPAEDIFPWNLFK